LLVRAEKIRKTMQEETAMRLNRSGDRARARQRSLPRQRRTCSEFEAVSITTAD
jgi:hypothetical protein